MNGDDPSLEPGSSPDASQDAGAMAGSLELDDRYSAVRQYSLAQIVGVWAAAAIPMGVLSWIVAPWLRDRLSGAEPLARALFICLTVPMARLTDWYARKQGFHGAGGML